ncbi:hypothetical protein D3C80_509590 [compost metagenome]
MSPETVAHDAKEQATERAHQKGHRECGESCNGLNAGCCIGKENLPQSIGYEAIDAEIEPLHRIAQGRCSNGFFEFRVVDDLNIVNL